MQDLFQQLLIKQRGSEVIKTNKKEIREIITLEDVSISYGNFKAVKNVFCNFKKGKITSLIGPSGCGKSTVLRSLNRMNDLISNCSLKGTVTFDGVNIYDKRVDPVEVRRRIGMVFQQPKPPYGMNVRISCKIVDILFLEDNNRGYALREQ